MSQADYKIRLRNVPKDFQVEGRIQRSFEASMQRHGVPLDVAERIFNECVGDEIGATKEKRAAAARAIEETTSINRARFGAGYERKIESAWRALEALGFERVDQPLEQLIPDANRIERLAQNGERVAAARGRPLQSSNHSGESNVNNSAPSLRTLQLKLAEMQIDPKFKERFFDQRHPLHQQTLEIRQDLLNQIAAATAVERGDARPISSAGQSTAADLRGQLARLHADPTFMAELKDPRHFRHAERVSERAALISKISAEEASHGKPTARSAKAIQREMDELKADPTFMADVGAGGARPTAGHHAAMERHQGLVNELASAQRQESGASTQITAAGAPAGAGSTE
jgi:hypothetical protein